MADDSDSTSSCKHLPGTRSRCITESVTATFDFNVINYPDLRSMHVGAYISSPIFRVGGHNWTIRLYPNGEVEKYRDKVSAYLECVSLGKEDVITTKFKLGLLQKDGQVKRLGKTGGTFPGSDSSKSWDNHIVASKNKLKSLSIFDDGCSTIRCVLTVMENSPLPELHGNLERMLRDGVGTDITFIVGGQPFRAHRAILAVRSPIFEAQLFDPATEKHTECVEVVDMDPAIFEMLLYFVYTDLLPPCNDDEGHDEVVLQRLLVAADRYGLDRLKLTCEDKLCRKIDVERVMVLFALADQYHCKQLRSACLDFMARPEVLETILAADGFKNLHAGTQ